MSEISSLFYIEICLFDTFHQPDCGPIKDVKKEGWEVLVRLYFFLLIFSPLLIHSLITHCF